MSKATEKEMQGATGQEQQAPAAPETEQKAPAPAQTGTAQQAPAAPAPYSAAWLEERVPLSLIWDGKRYKDDVFVAVNGERCQIQRGKQVMVKRKFALAYENSREQDAQAARVIAKFADNFEEVKNALS